LKKVILLAVGLVAAVLVLVFFMSARLLDLGSNQALRYMVKAAPRYGVQLQSPRFQSIAFAGRRGLTWKNCSVGVKAKKGGLFSEERAFLLSADEWTVRLVSFFDRTLSLEAKGLSILPDAADPASGLSSEPSDQFLIQDFKVQFRIDFLNRRSLISESRHIFRDLCLLFTEGSIGNTRLQFLGKSTFSIRQKTAKAKILAKIMSEESRLYVDKADLKVISRSLGEALTDQEMTYLSENPIKMPKLLRIRDYARSAAKQAHEKEDAVPEDVYRRMLWSYLLTKAYDTTFAEQVTTAHVAGAVGLSPQDKQMILDTYAAGRHYASEGVPESGILDRALRDSARAV